jgi:MFS family permease
LPEHGRRQLLLSYPQDSNGTNLEPYEIPRLHGVLGRASFLNDLPALADRSGIYYGWWVVAALFLSGFMLFGGGLYSFILMVPVMGNEFHWSRAASGGMVSAFWLTAPVALAGGFLIRRFGTHRLLIAGVLIESICLVAFALTSTLSTMYVLRALMGLGKVLLAICTPVAVARWFSRHFGLGCAISWAGWHLGGLVLSPITGAAVAVVGWRLTCVGLAVAMILMGLLPLLLAMRIKGPEELGVGLDGADLDSGVATTWSPDDPHPKSTGFRVLVVSPHFWLIAAGTICFWTAYAGALTHQSGLVENSGVSGRWASLALGSTAAFAAIGTLASGWFVSRWNLVTVGLVTHGLVSAGVLGLLLFSQTGSLASLSVQSVCLGLSIGAANVFWTTVLKRRLGDSAFYYNYSIWYFFVVATLLTAPVFAGFLYDATGTYTLALTFLLASALAGGIIGVLAALERPDASPLSVETSDSCVDRTD